MGEYPLQFIWARVGSRAGFFTGRDQNAYVSPEFDIRKNDENEKGKGKRSNSGALGLELTDEGFDFSVFFRVE